MVDDALMTALAAGPDDGCRQARVFAECAAPRMGDEDVLDLDCTDGYIRVRRFNCRVYSVTFARGHDTIARMIEL